jgi:hypothetical protein
MTSTTTVLTSTTIEKPHGNYKFHKLQTKLFFKFNSICRKVFADCLTYQLDYNVFLSCCLWEGKKIGSLKRAFFLFSFFVGKMQVVLNIQFI